MKILVFSDTHLGKPFEEKKFNFLKGIISDVDHVVINGDFWEGYEMKFDDFIESPWKHLFPLLKSKKPVYLHGNHDHKDWVNDKYSLFADSLVTQYKIPFQDTTFHIEHGDRLAPLLDAFLPVYKLPLMGQALDSTEDWLIRTFGQKYLDRVHAPRNNEMKRKFRKESQEGEFLICGHTHYAELDESHKYANTGFIRHGIGQYILIEDGRIITKNERYI